jgi:hypothetical protein
MFMSSMTSKYYINVFQASHHHQIIITLVNLAKDLRILQKNFKQELNVQILHII